MSGWFHVQMDALHRVQSERFNKVLHSEPVEQMQNDLFAVDAATIRGGDCHSFCALIYDAVWAAAIAASRTATVADGNGLDKAKLLRELRGVGFVGASGQVSFDPATCDKGSTPMVINNMEPGVGPAGTARRSRWSSGSGLRTKAWSRRGATCRFGSAASARGRCLRPWPRARRAGPSPARPCSASAARPAATGSTASASPSRSASGSSSGSTGWLGKSSATRGSGWLRLRPWWCNMSTPAVLLWFPTRLRCSPRASGS
mmetsp:Transcript_34034/g.81081  ORF Transcript_34034/g.81081 Transcript_34034/m.81081 type:complete len:259 (+) Transcript_34034:1160-1936(+)